MATKKTATSARSSSPRYRDAAVVVDDGALHEVTVVRADGHATVERVRASSKAAAEKIVSERLDLAQRDAPQVADVAGPAELRKREERGQQERTEQLRAAGHL